MTYTHLISAEQLMALHASGAPLQVFDCSGELGDAAKADAMFADKRIAGDVMPSFKWRHTAWIEELGIPVRTSAKVLAIGDGGVKIRNAQREEEFLPADTVIAAVARRPNQELFHELEWMIDELHGCGDSLVPRGLTQAIHDGFRLGARI